MSRGPRNLSRLRHIGPRVWWFQLRARLVAPFGRDGWSLKSTVALDELGALIWLFEGRTQVVELGTGTAWTSCSLLLARKDRAVTTYDHKERAGLERYLGLLRPEERSRLRVVLQASQSITEVFAVDAVFIDSSHLREETVATFSAWQPVVEPGGVVVFHDYGHPQYPGVAEAVRELGLEGETLGRLFVWRAPA
jgi:hypothetical protein